jgi:hypothetical protein
VTDYAEDAKLFKPAHDQNRSKHKIESQNDARQARID